MPHTYSNYISIITEADGTDVCSIKSNQTHTCLTSTTKKLVGWKLCSENFDGVQYFSRNTEDNSE